MSSAVSSPRGSDPTPDRRPRSRGEDPERRRADPSELGGGPPPPASIHFASLSPELRHRYRAAAGALAATALALSLVVLIGGWIVDIERLRTFVSDHVAVRANGAIVLTLLSGALALRVWGCRSRRARILGALLAAVAGVTALATLLEWIGGVSLGLDEIIFKGATVKVSGAHPERIPANGALAVALIAAALVLSFAGRRPRLRQWLAIGSGIIGLVALLGYASQVEQLSGVVGRAQVAVPTALVLLALSSGLMMTEPGDGVMAWLTRASPGARMARLLLPALIVIPSALSTLLIVGIRNKWFSDSVGVWLTVLILIAAYCAVTVAYARELDRADRRRQAEALAGLRTERHFRAMVEAANEGVWIIGPDGVTRYANDALATMLGTTPEEMVGEAFTAFADEDAIAEVRIHLARRARGISERYELRLRHADGSAVWVLVSAVPMYNLDGSYAGSLSMLTDYTERRRAGVALRESEERYRSVVNALSEGIVVQNAGGEIVACNHAAEQILGFSAEQLAGRTSVDPRWRAIHEDGSPFPGETHPAAETLRTGRSLHEVIMGVHKPDGTLSWISINAEPLHLREGDRPDAVVTTFTDITERHRADAALRESEGRYRGLVSMLGEGLITRDAHGVITACNAAAERILRLPRDELIGMREPEPRLEITRRDGSAITAEELPSFEALRTGRSCRGVVLGVRPPDAELWWIVFNSEPLRREGESQPYAVVTTFNDVTEQYRASEQIRTMNETLERRVKQRTAELESSNRALEAFAYSVAHDLRGPLSTIAGFAGLLGEGHIDADDTQGRHMLGRIELASGRMSELIDALLLLSRLSRHELELAPVDLSAIASEIVEDLRAHDPSRTVEVEIEDGLAAVADPPLVRILLRNLLENAWKFTSRAEHPAIRFARAGGEEFVVADNGAGFDMAYAELLFRPFARLHREDEFSGLGVGLTTSERIVRRHGGAIRAEAVLGAGARFYFSLRADTPN